MASQRTGLTDLFDGWSSPAGILGPQGAPPTPELQFSKGGSRPPSRPISREEKIQDLIGRPGNAEPGAPSYRLPGGGPVAICGPNGPRVPSTYEPPRSTRQKTIAVEPRRAIERRAIIAFIPAVRAPLPDVAVRIVQAQGVGLELATGAVLLLSHWLPQPSQLALPLTDILGPTSIRRRGTRPRRVLPFGLA